MPFNRTCCDVINGHFPTGLTSTPPVKCCVFVLPHDAFDPFFCPHCTPKFVADQRFPRSGWGQPSVWGATYYLVNPPPQHEIEKKKRGYRLPTKPGVTSNIPTEIKRTKTCQQDSPPIPTSSPPPPTNPYHARLDLAGGKGHLVRYPDQNTPSYPVNRTDMSENITLPRTTYVIGNKLVISHTLVECIIWSLVNVNIFELFCLL